jgi:hypothetical protein
MGKKRKKDKSERKRVYKENAQKYLPKSAFLKTFKAKTPTTKVMSQTKTSSIPRFTPSICLLSRMKAPMLAGKNIQKDKMKASSLSIPKNNPVDIVEPDLDTPGKSAKVWASPIIKEFLKFAPSLPPLKKRVRKRNREVIRKVKGKILGFSNVPSSSLKKKTAGKSGNIPIMERGIYLLRLSRLKILSLKTKITDKKVAVCKKVS